MAQDDMKSGRRILTVCSRPMILESSKALLRANGDTVVMVENRVLPPQPLGLRSQPSHGRLTTVTSDGNIKGNSAGGEYGSQYTVQILCPSMGTYTSDGLLCISSTRVRNKDSCGSSV